MAPSKTVCSDWFALDGFPAFLDQAGILPASDVSEAIMQLVCAGYLEVSYTSQGPRYRMVLPHKRSITTAPPDAMTAAIFSHLRSTSCP